MEGRKSAEQKIARDMEQDLENYLRKMQRDLTGRNTRALPGQPENITQKVAGMHIEDAIMAIFKFANESKKRCQGNFQASGLFKPAERVMETMMFFNSRPLFSKFFHVILATGLFRTLGKDDVELLNILGFKDALKKMAEQHVKEIADERHLAPNGPNSANARNIRRFPQGELGNMTRFFHVVIGLSDD